MEQTAEVALVAVDGVLDLSRRENLDDNWHNEATELNVVHLKLHESKLPRVPLPVLRLTSLVRLELWSNSISELPEEISNLQKLEYLDLSANSLRTLPDCLTALTALR
jgi:Leucine-rich repeat (LRR) protein